MPVSSTARLATASVGIALAMSPAVSRGMTEAEGQLLKPISYDRLNAKVMSLLGDLATGRAPISRSDPRLGAAIERSTT